ncbi:MAG TPA: lysine transporter LysE [Gammaproteobacteria bacterium]|nr:lysine transporter LysE [Gammaproteobacteria bacterium]
MPLSLWLSMSAICIIGAMSPGPSLAVVVQNTLAGGRAQGLLTAVSHGAGIFIWALLTAGGIALLITRHPALFDGMRFGGALLLVYLGVRSLRSASQATEALANTATSSLSTSPARDGFLIAITNPKIALFFLALFSQFVRAEAGLTEKIIMATSAGIIDALWYALVALVLSHSAILERLRRRAALLDRIFGVILLALAVRVAL